MEYEKFEKTFSVKGWPNSVPFSLSGRLSQSRIDKIMDAMPFIEFEKIISTEPVANVARIAEEPATNISNNTEEQQGDEDIVMMEPESTSNAIRMKKPNAKKGSFVKKGDIIPIIPSVVDSDEKFYLFICDGKSKIDCTIKGKWLTKSSDRTYVKSRDSFTVLESNVFVSDGKRIVLCPEDFERLEANHYVLKNATCNMLNVLFENL